MTVTAPRRDRLLLAVALVTFGLWLITIGPVRAWADGVGLRDHWVLGVAPSFLAGFTLANWTGFVARTEPLTSAAFAVTWVVLAEASQLVLPRYTADLWDVLAGMVGAALAVPLLQWRAQSAARR